MFERVTLIPKLSLPTPLTLPVHAREPGNKAKFGEWGYLGYTSLVLLQEMYFLLLKRSQIFVIIYHSNSTHTYIHKHTCTMDLVLMEAILTLVSKFSCINAWSTQTRSFLYSLSSCIFDLHTGSYLYFIHYSGCELKPKTRSQGNLFSCSITGILAKYHNTFA